MTIGIAFLSGIPRTSFGITFLLYSAIFGGLVALYLLSPKVISWRNLFLAGLTMRVAVFFFSPQWSDDYFRFLWDGELLEMGENPYLEIPRDFLEKSANDSSAYLNQLFEGLNSRDYYSVYPPINQLIFWIGAKASMGFVWNGYMMLRLILILAESAVFILLWKLLRVFELPQKQILWYWLNPLVVLEIVGNLHFEGFVLLFLLASLWFFQKGRLGFSGGFWALAIGVKLLPLILAPAFLANEKVRKSRLFWLGTILILVLCFSPLFIENSWMNFFQSLKLYQGKFEFNASMYYLLREIGFWIKGYNIIADLTKGLSILTLVLILFFSFKRKSKTLQDMLDLWVLIYLIYLILQPVVHPWYILPGLGLSIFSRKVTFLLWSFAAIFSYQAYGNPDFMENSVFLFLAYGVVFFGVYVDYFKKERSPNFMA
ncbi:glycosyltransferase family 87 protein [Algoriphagus boseongensis]|nr:glycosyltransferase family 87 protein [Algoriphagus boseongensis]